MNAAVMKPRIKQDQATSTPEDRLSDLRKQAQSLREELGKLTAKHRRCIEDATALESRTSEAEKARKQLESLHGLRAAGGKVTDAEVKRAESNLRTAQQEADRVAPMVVGAKNAAAQFLQEAKAVEAQLGSVRSKAIQEIGPLLLELARSSMKAYEGAMRDYAVCAAKHAGEILAIREWGQSLGLGDLQLYPNGCFTTIDLPTTRTHADPPGGGGNKNFDLRTQIASASTQTKAELRELLP